MHNNVISAKKFVLICKSTEIRPLTKQQWGSVSSNLHFSAGKQGVRLFDINKSPTLFVLSLYGRNGPNFPSCFFL